ncbi:MAG: hypothetical protein LV480_01590 [Methylacidiphilales bacterium]|nr:hypothetical protein [Candidatus Methylacidiphilales bacterium]
MNDSQVIESEGSGKSRRRAILCWAAALSLVGCSSGTPIQEVNYVGGMETSSAVVVATPNGGYQTISGDPDVAIDGGIEQESMLPYGGGDQGIRQAEDEAPAFIDEN